MSDGLVRGGRYTAAFAFNEERGLPWHNLGTPVSGAQTVEEMLIASHADFEVHIEPIMVNLPTPVTKWGVAGWNAETDEAVYGNVTVKELQPHQVLDRQMTWCHDPFTGEVRILGDVGARYTRMQNRATAEFALAVVGASAGDAVIDTMGVLDNCKRFFAYIDLGDLVIDPSGVNDKIARGIGITNSHDGSLALTVANTDTRFVCANTVRFGIKHAKAVWKAKHTPTLASRAEEAQRALKLEAKWAVEFTKRAEQLLAIPVSVSDFDEIVKAAWPIAAEPSDTQKKNHDEIRDTLRTIWQNDRNAGVLGFNGWSAHNAIGEYIDHLRPGTKADREAASIDPESSWSKRKLTAEHRILALA